MKHDIQCVQYAIECARENVRDANIEIARRNFEFHENAQYIDDSTRAIYIIANDYIDDQMITCHCIARIKNVVYNELRECYDSQFRDIDDLYIEIYNIENTTQFHVVVTYTYANEKYIDSMIVETTFEKTYFEMFKTFHILNEININTSV